MSNKAKIVSKWQRSQPMYPIRWELHIKYQDHNYVLLLEWASADPVKAFLVYTPCEYFNVNYPGSHKVELEIPRRSKSEIEHVKTEATRLALKCFKD